MKDKMTKCPFCGNNLSDRNSNNNFGWGKFYLFFSFLEECDFHFLDEKDIKLAIKSWNPKSGIWVNVKEKIPPEGERVLVFHEDRVIRIGMAENGELRSVVNKDGKICKVTHWKPMPVGPISFGLVNISTDGL